MNNRLTLQKARRARWKAEGLCARCGGEREEKGYTNCVGCRAYMRDRMAERLLWRMSRGLCGRCELSRPIEGLQYCQACRSYYSQTSQERRQRLRDEGMCIHCGQEPAIRDQSLCEGCRQRNLACIHRRKGSGR